MEPKNRRRWNLSALLGLAATALLPSLPGCDKHGVGLTGLRVVDVRTEEDTSLDAFVGQPTIVSIWTTFCASCRTELPMLERVHEDLAGQGLRVVAVSVEKNPTRVVRLFADRFGLTFPVFQDRSRSVERAFSTWGVPQNLFIDRNGDVQRFEGPIDWSDPKIRMLVRDLLARPRLHALEPQDQFAR